MFGNLEKLLFSTYNFCVLPCRLVKAHIHSCSELVEHDVA